MHAAVNKTLVLLSATGLLLALSSCTTAATIDQRELEDTCERMSPPQPVERTQWPFLKQVCMKIIPSWYKASRNVAYEKELKNGEYVIEQAIRLDRKGNLLSIELKKSSGVEALDDAAFEAWKAVSPLPAPPASLFDAQGKALINWTLRSRVGG